MVNSLYQAVKLDLPGVTRQELNEPESRRAFEIQNFTTNLDHVGGIVDRKLMEPVVKKMKHCVRFSPASFEVIGSIHAMVLASLRLALNVFITGDLDLAWQLLAQSRAAHGPAGRHRAASGPACFRTCRHDREQLSAA